VELNVITGGCYTLESADGAVHAVREDSLFMNRLMNRQCSSNREKQPNLCFVYPADGGDGGAVFS
jgi:hypothetical protein